MVRASSQIAGVSVPKVYIETTVFKFSATVLFRLLGPREQAINWGNGQISKHTYYEPRYVNPNESIRDENLRSEADLLQRISELIKKGCLTAVADIETRFEAWGLPKMDSLGGPFYGAPVGSATPPVKSDRLLFCAGHDPKEMQQHYVRGVKHPRFLELQRMTGGYQGVNPFAGIKYSTHTSFGARSAIVAITS